jgi:hypothetical protein
MIFRASFETALRALLRMRDAEAAIRRCRDALRLILRSPRSGRLEGCAGERDIEKVSFLVPRAKLTRRRS